MGGGFDRKTRVIDCLGQQVTNTLNQVFRNPGTPKYQYAQANNTFDTVLPNVQGNWKDLIIAYVVAGVDVGNEWPAWVAYLETLGTAAQGPQNIYDIAQTRYNALRNNLGVTTTTHGGGGPVHATPTTINSPCPP
jgi:hypothetical protein